MPIGLGKVSDGAEAIVTILDDKPPLTVEDRLKELDIINRAIDSAAGEEMPTIEPLRFREEEL